MHEISRIFRHVRAFFYANDMKLFLPVRDSRDCLKIQNDLNRLAEWCEANALALNVGKCKAIMFSRLRQHGVNLLNFRTCWVCGIIIILNVFCWAYYDVTVGKALAMLGFVKWLSCDFRDPYTLKTLYVSLVRPKLEYTSCMCQTFYAAHIDRIELGFFSMG
jgi:hypothetical protein